MSDTLKSIWFAALTALISSLLLTGASSGLKTYRVRNIEIDTQKNLLKSVGLVQAGRKYTAEEIERLYRDNIRPYRVDARGLLNAGKTAGPTELPLFLYIDGQAIQSYILPVHSRGLWGKIEGYLALENDGATVAGFTVFSHQETPGLGGEIETGWFQKNFQGKIIVDGQGAFAALTIAKGKAADRVPADRRANFVDGISGATLTGRFLSEGLQETLAAYEKVSANFRGKRINLTIGETASP